MTAAMNILFVGDVVGRPGRRALFQHLEALRRRHQLSLVVVNAENAAAGFGITESIAAEFFDRGVDVLTSGNHIWDKREALDFIEHQPRLLRPANYPPGTPGKGLLVTDTTDGRRVAVLNVMGTVFMHPVLDCPFRCVDRLLSEIPEDLDAVLVDFHAEATSEKQAMGWHLDGRVSAVVGSHTHVPTADERVLPGGTAYISDAGMTGCYDSIIGMQIDSSLQRFTTRLNIRFEVAGGKGTLCGVVLGIDKTGRATAIERIALREN
jgi:metallophosphoesterase (TIGR00282 family)